MRIVPRTSQQLVAAWITAAAAVGLAWWAFAAWDQRSQAALASGAALQEVMMRGALLEAQGKVPTRTGAQAESTRSRFQKAQSDWQEQFYARAQLWPVFRKLVVGFSVVCLLGAISLTWRWASKSATNQQPSL